MNAELTRIGAIVWKDLTAERRTKANFNAVVFLAGLILLLFGFAIGTEQASMQPIAGGVIWLTVLFSGTLSFNRSYEQELENGALEMLLLYPGDRRSLFVGKLLANLLFVLLVEVVMLPTAALLYNLPIWTFLAPLSVVLLLGTIGFVTLGTFYAAMASRLRAREVMLPLLLFPMLVPLLVGAVQATGGILNGDIMGSTWWWVRFLFVFDVIFFVAALFAFEYVIED
ncbi:MAG TPA: heme exporter protein CcmB [Longimicrobiales bacterium]|nr:heme exporter protein CcmB [Longimicrobiales bacterium]